MTPAPATQEETPRLTTDQLLGLLSDDLDKLVTEVISDEYQSERRIAVNRAKRNWRFIKGDHFLAPAWVDDGAGDEYADYISVDGSTEDNGAKQKFCYPVNLVAGDCWTFVAVTGTSAPNVKCEADDLDSQDSIDAAKNADISVIDLKAKWNADELQPDLSFHQFTTGPSFGHTRYVTNGRKYGKTKVPKMGLEPQIGPDGSIAMVPVPVGEEEYENGDVELSIYNILHVEVPFGKKKLEDCRWLRCRYLEDKYTLLGLYRKRLAEFRNDDGRTGGKDAAANAGLEAQDATSHPSGSGKATKKGNWLFDNTFLDYEVFEGIQDPSKRKLLQEYFPNGLHATKVNDTWVDLEDENKNDGWSVCKVGRGEYIMENPIIHDEIPFQKAINDMFGLAVEMILRAIPKTIVDQAILSRKAAGENDPTPAEILFTIGNHSGDISKGIASLPMARFSDQLVPFINTVMRPWMQKVSGVRDELSGGGQPTSTYREAKQRKDQAMMTLAPCSNAHNKFWEKTYENGTRLRARFGSGQIKVTKDTGFGKSSETVDQEQLTEGLWHCEADEGVAMSFTERADRLLGLLKEYPPEVVSSLALTDIANISELLHLLQLAGFKSPMEDAYRKAVKIISQLAQEEPVQDIDPMTGAPTMLPSIPLDDIEEDPSFFLQVAQRWMNSPEAEKVKLKSPAGYENVKARARQAKQMSQAAMMAAAPPPADGAPGNAPPPAEAQSEPLPPAPIDAGSFAPQPAIQ